MQLATWTYQNESWQEEGGALQSADFDKVQLVLIFGDTDTLQEASAFETMRRRFPKAHIVGASSSGNILGARIIDAPLCATAVYLERSHVALSKIRFGANDDLKDASRQLIEQLPKEGLRHIFIVSDGLLVNGSDLVRGINAVQTSVSVTGGMAGDGDRFAHTYVIADDLPREATIAAIGWYGESLSISSGCYGGWSEFGAVRTITKSDGNLLYEIDGEPALQLYRRYLGDQADQLPNSGLRFPLSIRPPQGGHEMIRTLLAINDSDQSITFAGDIPEGYHARLMKPDLDVLIEGAGIAAESIHIANDRTALGLVVSCVGRKIVMNQFVDDELEAVEEILGPNVQLTGFYSYGEIAPFSDAPTDCALHNQTMTLTVIYEA
ncbi:MAG: FIST C-terminal domain-containing protein [Campylobacterales bacterium]|nr:FIST C-terminal domain-containing protein [Campylobacterales bacterium]